MKRNLGAIMAAALAACLVLAVTGCKKAETTVQAGSGGEGTNSRRLSDGKTTFSVFIGGLDNLVTSYDYKDNVFTKKIVDETGVNLEFVATTGADAAQRLNMLLNTGDYPDLIIRNLGLDEINFYAKEGIFIPLDAHNPLGFPNIKAAFDEYPAFNDILRGSDGKLYGLPAANDCIHCRYGNNQYIYYLPFLQKSGLRVPETLDELTAYLRWVRDNDVNGNGSKNDEIPLAFYKDGIRNFMIYFAQCFMPFSHVREFGLARNGTQVEIQYQDPRYREALKYLAGIYKEGLIFPDSFTQTGDQFGAIVTADTPILAVNIGGGANRNGTEYYYRARWLPVLTGPTGEKHSYDVGPWSILSAGMFITDKCKDPKLALGLYNYFLNFDVMMDAYIGPKGYGWDDADAGSLSLVGQPAVFKTLKTYGTADVNYTWNQNLPMLRNQVFRYGEQAMDVPTIQKWLETGDLSLLDSMKANKSYNEVKNVLQALPRMPFGTPVEQAIPPLSMSDADARRVADINAVLNTIIDQAIVEFVTGARNVSNDAVWNAYLADLDRAGAKEKAGIIAKYLK